MNHTVVEASRGDLPLIMAFIAHSRNIMRANGNRSQWVGYPDEAMIAEDLSSGIGHLILTEGRPVGYFALLLTPEPTYARIDDGQWIDDTTPYGTLHRLCRTSGVQGVAQCAFDWAESRCASIRVDTHRDNEIMLNFLQRSGYTRCGIVWMEDGSPREAFQKMTYPMVDASLRHYVEAEILSRYQHFDSAHRPEHVQTVMAQSMELAGHYPQLDPNMVYTIAAYHDTGIVDGRDVHHLASGRIIRTDQQLHKWFSPEQIETMAQAAEDHRASGSEKPRSLYGRIVAEADRDIEPVGIVRRALQFGLSHYPQLDREGQWQRTLQHLQEKYAEGGYLRLFIPQSRNHRQLARLRALMADRTLLRHTFDELYNKLNQNDQP